MPRLLLALRRRAPHAPASRGRRARPRCRTGAIAFLTAAAACGSATDVNARPPVPPLEDVPYALLGSGKLAFERITTDGRTNAVYVIDAAAASSAHAFDDQVEFGIALSPDGARFAYDAYSGSATAYDVWVANADGTDRRQVSDFAGQEGPPTWTPDGRRIVFAGSDDNLTFNVYTQSPVPNPTDRRPVTHLSPDSGAALHCPIITDNETPVAVSSRGELALSCAGQEINVLLPTGTPAAAYRPARADSARSPNVFAPAWSPDGSHLAFIQTASDPAANYALVGFVVKVMNADGSGVATIAAVDAHESSVLGGFSGPNNFSLCWTADGSRLVFNVPEKDLVGHLWLVHPDGTGLAQLTSARDVWDRDVSCAR